MLNRARLVGTTLAVLAVAAAAGSSAVPGAGVTSPRWTKLPVTFGAGGGNWFRVLGWASGRFWFGVGGYARSTGGPIGTIWSAKVTGSRLTSFVSSRVTDNQIGQSFRVGSTLVEGDSTAADISAALLPSGKVGPWVPIPGDPVHAVRQLITDGSMAAGVAIGARTVWLVASGSKLGACCTDSGGATDLTSILVHPIKLDPLSIRLGLDAHGRLWLAWAERVRDPIVTLHLAQLDPATLTAISSKSYGPAGNGGGGGSQASDDFTLACADSCRLVFSSPTAILSWGGEAAPTRLVANAGHAHALLAAAYVGQTLQIVTTSGGSDYGWHVGIGRAAARGSLVAIAAAGVPQVTPHPNEVYNAAELRSAATPAGFVVLAGYPASGRKLQPLEGTVLGR